MNSPPQSILLSQQQNGLVVDDNGGREKDRVKDTNNSHNSNHGSKNSNNNNNNNNYSIKRSHIRPKTTTTGSATTTPIKSNGQYHPTTNLTHTSPLNPHHHPLTEVNYIVDEKDDLMAHKSLSFETSNTSSPTAGETNTTMQNSINSDNDEDDYWLDELTLRTQLWDAYRLARVILGKTISKFTLDSATILHAIRVVAEMKLELIGLHQQMEYYNTTTTSQNPLPKPTIIMDSTTTSSSTPIIMMAGAVPVPPGSSSSTSNKNLTSTALDSQIMELQEQLTSQLTKYQDLDKEHQSFVQETKLQLQDIFIQLHALPKSSVTPKQAADIQVTLQKLIQTVAIATTKPQMDLLRQEIEKSQHDTKQIQQQLVQVQEELQSQQQLYQFTIDTTKIQYEQQLAVCQDQIAMYKDQVTHQEEQLVYSHKQLEELILSPPNNGHTTTTAGGGAGTGAAGATTPTAQQLSKKFARVPSFSSLTSPSGTTATRAVRIQDSELQGMLLTLETIVPQLVESVQRGSSNGEKKKKKQITMNDDDGDDDDDDNASPTKKGGSSKRRMPVIETAETQDGSGFEINKAKSPTAAGTAASASASATRITKGGGKMPVIETAETQDGSGFEINKAKSPTAAGTAVGSASATRTKTTKGGRGMEDDDDDDVDPYLQESSSSLRAPKRPTTDDTTAPRKNKTKMKDNGNQEEKDGTYNDDDGEEEDDDEHWETTLELQRRVSDLLQQVSVHQTTRRVTELKMEIAETVEIAQQEDAELIHLKQQLELLQRETKFMTREEFEQQIYFWQQVRQKYERQLEELKRQVWRKKEIKVLNQQCDNLALLAVEMEEFHIIEKDDQEGMGPMLELIQARKEACVTGTQKLKEQLQEVRGDYEDFCHAIEHTLLELQSSSWLIPAKFDNNNNNDDEDKKKESLVELEPHEDGQQQQEDFTRLQTRVKEANTMLMLEQQLKLRDQELAKMKSELTKSQERIAELEQQVLEGGTPDWFPPSKVEGVEDSSNNDNNE